MFLAGLAKKSLFNDPKVYLQKINLYLSRHFSTLVTFFNFYKCLTINLNHWKSILFPFENSDFMPYFDDFFRPGPGGSYIFISCITDKHLRCFYNKECIK